MANSEDPDEISHKMAFHQGLHCLLRLKQSSGTEISFYRNLDQQPLEIQNGLFHSHSINITGAQWLSGRVLDPRPRGLTGFTALCP